MDKYYPDEIKFFRDPNPMEVERQFREWSASLGPAQIERPTFRHLTSPQQIILVCLFRRCKEQPYATKEEEKKS